MLVSLSFVSFPYHSLPSFVKYLNETPAATCDMYLRLPLSSSSPSSPYLPPNKRAKKLIKIKISTSIAAINSTNRIDSSYQWMVIESRLQNQTSLFFQSYSISSPQFLELIFRMDSETPAICGSWHTMTVQLAAWYVASQPKGGKTCERLFCALCVASTLFCIIYSTRLGSVFPCRLADWLVGRRTQQHDGDDLAEHGPTQNRRCRLNHGGGWCQVLRQRHVKGCRCFCTLCVSLSVVVHFFHSQSRFTSPTLACILSTRLLDCGIFLSWL